MFDFIYSRKELIVPSGIEPEDQIRCPIESLNLKSLLTCIEDSGYDVTLCINRAARISQYFSNQRPVKSLKSFEET